MVNKLSNTFLAHVNGYSLFQKVEEMIKDHLPEPDCERFSDTVHDKTESTVLGKGRQQSKATKLQKGRLHLTPGNSQPTQINMVGSS